MQDEMARATRKGRKETVTQMAHRGQSLEFVALKGLWAWRLLLHVTLVEGVVALAAAGRKACLRGPAKSLERLRGLRADKRQP